MSWHSSELWCCFSLLASSRSSSPRPRDHQALHLGRISHDFRSVLISTSPIRHALSSSLKFDTGMGSRLKCDTGLTLLRPPLSSERGFQYPEDSGIERTKEPGSSAHESFHVGRRVALKHVVHRARQLRGKNAQRLPLAVLLQQPGVELLPLRVGPQEENRSFGERLLQVVVALLPFPAALLLAVRCLIALDQPAVRKKTTKRIETADIVDLIQQRQADDVADPMDALQQRKGVVIMPLAARMIVRSSRAITTSRMSMTAMSASTEARTAESSNRATIPSRCNIAF